MANTTIALRSSGTAAATPSLGVLANGELSINYADGIIYYKTASNTLGSIRTTQPAGLTTEVQFNDAGSFGSNAALTFNKTTSQLNVTNLLVNTTLTTGTGVGGIIAGANVIYANNFIANTGGITTTGNSSLNGIVTVNYNVGAASSQNAAIEMYGANTKGGTGYFDFLAANNRSTGTTNPSKWFRLNSIGELQVINSAYTLNLFNLDDSGNVTIPGYFRIGSGYVQFADGTRQYTANAGGSALSNTQILAGLQTVSNTANITFDTIIVANNGIGRSIRIGDDAWIGDVNLADTLAIRGAFNTANAYIVFGSADTTALGRAGSGALTYGGNTVWHAGNDGVGSGLDADLLDGFPHTAFANATFANTDYTTISATAGVYGNASHVPVTTLTANGRVSSITNTAIAISADAVTSGTLAVTRGGTGVTTSTGTGSVVLNTSPTLSTPTVDRVDWPASSTGAPTFTTRSAGTKLLFYPAISGSQVDYAMGIDSATLWSSVPVNSSDFYFKWYGGTTNVTSLDGTGRFTTSTINVYSTTASTSNTTGALTVLGGIGVKGNVSANGIIFDDGTRQTTAASAGASIGDVLALAIALG